MTSPSKSVLEFFEPSFLAFRITAFHPTPVFLDDRNCNSTRAQSIDIARCPPDSTLWTSVSKMADRMLRITTSSEFGNAARTRRDVLRIGGLGFLGLSLPGLLQLEANAIPVTSAGSFKKRAKRCILFFMEGGPSHIDLWDMKPLAPPEIRGIFKPITTSVPGIQFCEHLPSWAPLAHHLTFVRSVTHSIVDHNAGSYYALTGRSPIENGQLVVASGPTNAPPYGSVLSHLKPSHPGMPDFVHLPELLFNNGNTIPGQQAGFLGPSHDPFLAGDPSQKNYHVPGLQSPIELSLDRFERRTSLFEKIDQLLVKTRDHPDIDRMNTFYRKAISIITSPNAREAFDLSQEPEQVRSRYGINPHDASVKAVRQFGGLPHLGQCMLMARRLIERGVRLVTVCTGHRFDQSWDTHRRHFPLLTQSLLPHTNQAFSALLEDLHTRGLLDDTLVVAMGEFGRTPRLGQITSLAGADASGRDHWPHCYTVLLAGGGMRPGFVYGASDRIGAYPARDPVRPEDIAATIYTALGIHPRQRILDSLEQPHTIADGNPILDLFETI